MMLFHENRTDPRELYEARREFELLTKAGIDVIADAIAIISSPPNRLNYIGLTANTTGPVNTDVALTGEITTAGGGLIRAQAAYAHTTGLATFTLIKTFTANGSDALPVTIGKIGVFNASTAGSMGFETLLSSTATLSAIGDNVQITDTFTIS